VEKVRQGNVSTAWTITTHVEALMPGLRAS
jgi:hypothetical protein